MRRALRDLGHEVDLYTAYFDKRAWDVITNGMSDVPEPIILKEPNDQQNFSQSEAT